MPSPRTLLIRIRFRTWQIMSEELKTPGSVLVFDKLGPEPKFGLRGADRWTLEKQHQAGVELAPASVADPDGSRWPKLIADYISFGGACLSCLQLPISAGAC